MGPGSVDWVDSAVCEGGLLDEGVLLGEFTGVVETGTAVSVLGGGVKVTVAGATVAELTWGDETGLAWGVEEGLLA